MNLKFKFITIKTVQLVLSFFLLIVILSCEKAEKKVEKPNVLWLVVEDMSPFLSMYGDKMTTTPTLDALAENSILYTNAFSNGAQCSPARSTLISSVYAPMLATDWHRQKKSSSRRILLSQVFKRRRLLLYK